MKFVCCVCCIYSPMDLLIHWFFTWVDFWLLRASMNQTVIALWNSVWSGTKMLLCKLNSWIHVMNGVSVSSAGFSVLFCFLSLWAKLSLPSEEWIYHEYHESYWLLIWVVWRIYTHILHTYAYTPTHTDLIFLNFAKLPFLRLSGMAVQWYTSLSEIQLDSCPTESFHSALCVQFLEINNRPLHFGLWSPPAQSGCFSRCFRLGLLLQKNTTQVKPGQAGLPLGLRNVLFSK